MSEIDDFVHPKHVKAAPEHQLRMTTDPVVRTALLARRIRAMGAELRDISGPTRDLIIKMWSRGDTPAEIARATVQPLERIRRILDLNTTEPARPAEEAVSNDVAG